MPRYILAPSTVASKWSKKGPHPLENPKDEILIPRYHLILRTAHTVRLREYGQSDTPAHDNGVHLRRSLLKNKTFLVRSSKRYSQRLSTRLSSTGSFLSGILSATISYHSLFLYSEMLFANLRYDRQGKVPRLLLNCSFYTTVLLSCQAECLFLYDSQNISFCMTFCMIPSIIEIHLLHISHHQPAILLLQGIDHIARGKIFFIGSSPSVAVIQDFSVSL